jgi:tRNA uridine 5-carbamoylmethylation protein Kti12
LSASGRNRDRRSFSTGKTSTFAKNLANPLAKQTIKQAYGEEALSCSDVFKWHKSFAHLEDDEHTHRARKVRTELKTQEIATLVCANHSQMVDEVAAAAARLAMLLYTKFCLMTLTCIMLPRTMFHVF